MKISREQTSIVIELSYEEAMEIKEDLKLWGQKDEPSYPASMMFFELDELFGEDNS
jgi:hypothetical protein